MLLDHLVGAGEQRWWHGKAKTIGGFQIDAQFDFCGLLNGQ
jgi:hypothetical protein